MWDVETTEIDNGRKYRLLSGGKLCRFNRFFELLSDDKSFAAWYSSVLADYPADAFYWELPPLTRAVMDCPAEFVLVDAPSLAGLEPDGSPFADRFSDGGEDIAVFPNLGRDATMIVPAPRGATSAYPHIAKFLREAPGDQIGSLWRRTSRVLKDTLSDQPVWLSTAGGGVAWLHLRIDSRPKYYSHLPYRDPAFLTTR